MLEKRNKGFIIPLISIVIMLMAVVFGVIVLLMVALGFANLEQRIETVVEEPAEIEIMFNTFLDQKSNYPQDNNKMRNMLSMYSITYDDTIESYILNKKNNMLGNEVMLQIGDKKFGTSSSTHAVAFRKIAIPEGKCKTINLRKS